MTDPREHIAHKPTYTASADDLAGLADDARTAASAATVRCTCPVGNDAIGPHLRRCPNHPEAVVGDWP